MPRLALILLGPALAVAGFFVHLRAVEQHLAALQTEISAALAGSAAPQLTGIQALNVEPAALEKASGGQIAKRIVGYRKKH